MTASELGTTVKTETKQWNPHTNSNLRTRAPKQAKPARALTVAQCSGVGKSQARGGTGRQAKAAARDERWGRRRPGGYLVRGGGDAEDEAVGEVGAGHLRLAPRAPHCSGGWAEWWSCGKWKRRRERSRRGVDELVNSEAWAWGVGESWINNKWRLTSPRGSGRDALARQLPRPARAQGENTWAATPACRPCRPMRGGGGVTRARARAKREGVEESMGGEADPRAPCTVSSVAVLQT